MNKATTDVGATPLWIAVAGGHDEVMRVLLEWGAAMGQERFDDNSTPLNVAVQEESVEIVDLLLQRGASVHHIGVGGHGRKRPLKPVELALLLARVLGHKHLRRR